MRFITSTRRLVASVAVVTAIATVGGVTGINAVTSSATGASGDITAYVIAQRDADLAKVAAADAYLATTTTSTTGVPPSTTTSTTLPATSTTLPATTSTASSTTTTTVPPTTTTTTFPSTTTTTPPNTQFPDITTVGPRGTLTNYTGPCNVPAGTVIQNARITCPLILNANVQIFNSSIISTALINQVFLVDIRGGGVMIDHSELSCGGVPANGNGINGGGYVAIALNIHDCENGINGGSNYTLRDSYIHALKAGGAPHYDGIQNDGGSVNVTIRHNTIAVDGNAVSAIMTDNCFGPMTNVVIDNNKLSGGQSTVYADSRFGAGCSQSTPTNGTVQINFLNNRMTRGANGYAAILGTSNSISQSGNVDDMTGNPITL